MRKIVSILFAFCLNLQLFSQGITVGPEVRMLALGDSYTIGQSVGLNERWPHQFIAQLRIKGVIAVDPDYIATTGWTTKNLLQGIETKLNPDKTYNLVSILIGVNNQYQGIALASYEPDLQEIVDRALEIVSHDTSRVFMLSIPDYAYTPFGGGNSSISQGIDTYNAVNKKVAALYRINYIDITGISRQGLFNPLLVATDGLHPSGIQYEEWVSKILPRVEISQLVGLSKYIATSSEPTVHISIFPNPASSEINIYSDKQMELLRIIDIHGKLIREIKSPPYQLQMDLSDCKPGIYIAEAQYSDGQELIRLIICSQGI